MSRSLPETVWSPEDLAELIGDLQRYSQWLTGYYVKQRATPNGRATNPPTVTPAAVAYLQMLHAQKALTSDHLEALINELQTLLNTAPQVTFTLAGPPSNGLKKSLIQWCREHVAGDVLVSFQFNKTILGGMVVRYGSHIFDWSIRRQLLANRDKFAEVLRNV